MLRRIYVYLYCFVKIEGERKIVCYILNNIHVN